MKTVILKENATDLTLKDLRQVRNLSEQFQSIEFDRLTKLTLRAVYVTHLEPQTFRQMKQLEQLDLQLIELRILPPKIFDPMRLLNRLNLELPLVNRFDREMLAKNNRLQHLEICSAVKIFDTVILQYICKQLIVLKIVNSHGLCMILLYEKYSYEISMEKVQQFRLQVYDSVLLPEMADVRYLNLSASHLGDQIFAILQQLKQLRVLNLRHSYQKTLPLQLLGARCRLLVLILAENNLGEFDARKLDGFSDLMHLDLSRCELGKLSGFEHGWPCRYLRYLSLASNELDAVSFRSLTFDNLGYLHKLDLSANRIDGFPETRPFAGLVSLRIFRVNANRLVQLPRGCFAAMERLEILDLSENRFERVKSNWFAENGHPCLLAIDLHSNEIRELHANTMQQWPNLKVLNLSDNLIQDFDRIAFEFVPFVRNVDVSFNAIRELRKSAANRMEYVKVLSFQENLLERIDVKTFENLKSLRVLNLKFNECLSTKTVRLLEFSYQFQERGLLLFHDYD